MKVSQDDEILFDNTDLQYVIITSDEPWSEIWMPQLHFAYQLSKRYNTIFLGPPKQWKFSSLFKFKHRVKKYNDRLILIDYINLLPLSLGLFAVFVNDKLNEFLIQKKINFNAIKNPNLIMWRFDPFRSMYLFRNKSQKKEIFHVIDPIAGKDLDIPLAKIADLIIVTSPRFIDHYELLNSNVLQISQGADLDFYKAENSDSNIDEVKLSQDSVLLLGLLTDDIDYLFLTKLANHINSKLILIGPKKLEDPKKLNQLKALLESSNVHWFGSMPPAQFMNHVKVCRLGIITYDISFNDNNQFRSPLKAVSYLSANKKIVSNIDCEIPSLVNKAIYIANNESEYLQLIDKCFKGELMFDEKLAKEYLDSISYDKLLGKIFSQLTVEIAPEC